MVIQFPNVEKVAAYVNGIDYRQQMFGYLCTNITDIAVEADNKILDEHYWTSKLEAMLASDGWDDLYKPFHTKITVQLGEMKDKIIITLIIKEFLRDEFDKFEYVIS